MAIQTADKFFAILEKSRLLSEEQLAEARDEASNGDSKAAARSLVRKGLLTRWQAGQLLAGRSAFFLGKYKLIDLLGHGGMGRVFLGEHTTMNRRVALKILPRRIGRDPAARDRFLSEARAVAALDHPNIVQAYSVDNERDRYYLVMEFVDGSDLEELVKKDGPLKFATAAEYICQAAEGLAHGHERGMVHCDIKPSNLLVNKQGVVKLVDLGLARAAGRDVDDGSSDERVIGTVDYMAPEQGLESNDFDHRADIYSLGCTFYFLLTGRPPFPGGSLHQRILKHQTQEPTPITKFRADAPEELVEICQRMMAKSPDDRYQSASELSELLAPWRPAKRSSSSSGINNLKVAEPLTEAPAEGFPGIVVGGSPTATASVPTFSDSPKPRTKKPAGPAKEATEKVALLGTPTRKLIAGGVALFLLVGLLSAITLPFVLGGDDEPSEKQAAQSTAEPEQTPAAKRRSDDPESFEEDLLDEDGSDEVSDDESSTTDELPTDVASTEEEAPAESEPAPAEGVEPATTPAAEPGESKPAEEPKPVEPKPEQPAPKKPEEKPAEKPVVKPEPKPPTKPPSKPKPKKPPAKPKPSDPFSELADSVALPEPGAGTEAPAAASLGKLHLPANAACTVELQGGDQVLKGGRQFSLQAGGADRWIIHFAEAARAGAQATPVEVASVSLDKQSAALQFQWSDGVANVRAAYAKALGRCRLKFSVGGKTRVLPLAKPEHIEPLAIDFKRGSTLTNLPIANLSDPESLRLHVIRLEGDLPNHRIEPKGGIGGKEGVRIVFPSDGTVPTYGLAVKLAEGPSSPRVEVNAFVSMEQPPAPGAKKPPAAAKPVGAAAEMPLTMRAIQQAFATNTQNKGRLTALKSNPKLAAQMRMDGGQIKEQLAMADAALGQLQALSLQCAKLQKVGKIHFSVFAQEGDQKLQLVDTNKPMPEMKPMEMPGGGPADFDLNLSGDDDDDDGGEKNTFF